MKIWPAVDIRSGKCVRHLQGDYRKELVYGDSPADMAMRWENDGAEGIRVVDLDGARSGQLENFEPICQIAAQTEVPLIVGGGVRNETSVKKLIEIGIKYIVIGTRALKEPDWAISIAESYPGRILLGLDARDGLLASDGWVETTNLSSQEFAQKMTNHPFAGIISTDIAKDGMLEGPNFTAHQQLQEHASLPVIASGGVSNIDDITQLASHNIVGCVIGRALYEGRLTLANCIAAGLQRADSPTAPLSGASPP